MINTGIVLLLSASWFAGIGIAGYLAARRSASRCRFAALTLFGHGALSSAGLVVLLAVIHFHDVWPLSVHVHGLAETVSSVLDCDLEPSCGVLTILVLTGVVLLGSFSLTQISARLLLRRYSTTLDSPATSALASKHPLLSSTRLLVVHDEVVDAFSFAVLRLDRRRLFRAEDIIVMTSPLLAILAEDEIGAVLAHEVAHVTARDDRYLPFFRILSMLLFFDPVLRLLRRHVGRHHEFAADAQAARATRRPRSLARALLKVYLEGRPASQATGLFGRGDRSELVARIEALLAMEASGLGRDGSKGA